MSRRNRRDFAGGLLLAVTGGAIFFHAVASYDLGSFRSMGPGMVPAAMGVALAVFGLAMLLSPVPQKPAEEAQRAAPVVAAMAGCLGFVIALPLFGIVPAIVLVIVAACLAEPCATWIGSAVLGAVLIGLVVGVFDIGLDIRMPLLTAPF